MPRRNQAIATAVASAEAPRRAGGRARAAAPAPAEVAVSDKPGKEPFDIEVVLPRIREAVAGFPRAALFDLAAEGHGSVFEVLVACIISIRTLDEVTVQVARRLFAAARTPREIAAKSVAELDALIGASTFHEAKAAQIHQMAQRIERELGGELGCDEEMLLSFRGVGPKCANLALGIACGKPGIAVDIHVHRVVNRWGYVRADAPEKTMRVLMDRLPKRYWIEINSLLVPFGKHICKGTSPRCSTCPVLSMCQQVGVDRHR